MGCNYGAKNTLDYTYLTDAWHAGAEIRTRCEVREFEPREGGGWTVHYLEHTPEREGTKTQTQSLPRVTVTTDELVLSAGTLGTTYLLLRNRAALPGLSPRLGEGFSGNGDLLTFASRCTDDGMGGARAPRLIDAAYGPVITSAVRVPDELDGDGRSGRGFYIEDAGYPEFVSWMLQVVDTPSAIARALPILLHFARTHLARGNENISAEASDLLGDCHLSSGVLPLLVMGRDVPDGLMSLAGDRLEVDWRKDRGSERVLRRRQGGGAGRERRARRPVPGQPDLAPEPRHHRAPARRMPHGAHGRRGRGGPLRPRVQLPRAPRRGRVGDARAGGRQPEPDDRRARRPLRRRDDRGSARRGDPAGAPGGLGGGGARRPPRRRPGRARCGSASPRR